MMRTAVKAILEHVGCRRPVAVSARSSLLRRRRQAARSVFTLQLAVVPWPGAMVRAHSFRAKSA